MSKFDQGDNFGMSTEGAQATMNLITNIEVSPDVCFEVVKALYAVHNETIAKYN